MLAKRRLSWHTAQNAEEIVLNTAREGQKHGVSIRTAHFHSTLPRTMSLSHSSKKALLVNHSGTIAIRKKATAEAMSTLTMQ